MGKDKTVAFEWDGKTYRIAKMRLKRIKEFMACQKKLANSEDEVARFEAIEEMLRAANCPEEVLDDLTTDEIQACIDALSKAHFPATGGDEGNGQAAGVTH